MTDDEVREIMKKFSNFIWIEVIAWLLVLALMIVGFASIFKKLSVIVESLPSAQTATFGTIFYKDSTSGIELSYIEKLDLVCSNKTCWDIKDAPAGIKRFYRPEMTAKIIPVPVASKPPKIEERDDEDNYIDDKESKNEDEEEDDEEG